jgi:hypothetical protein
VLLVTYILLLLGRWGAGAQWRCGSTTALVSHGPRSPHEPRPQVPSPGRDGTGRSTDEPALRRALGFFVGWVSSGG